MKFVTCSFLIFFFLGPSISAAPTSSPLDVLFQVSGRTGHQNETMPAEKNSIGMDLVTVPPGYFYMGSHGKGINADEAPIHKVTLSKPFLMGNTEVTNAQYELFDPEHKRLRGKYGLSNADDEAVISVDYEEATDFCRWLSEKEGRPYRLPTEAEWEYACRAGTFLKYSMDNGLPEAYQKNQKIMWGVDSTVTLKVRSTPPNPFGLFEMHGNVEEWCHDWYGPYVAGPQVNPVGRVDGNYRVTRGGSHSTPVEFLRSANRMAMIPEDKHWLTGFRVVQGEMPNSEPLPLPEKPFCMQQVSQKKFQWEKPVSEAFFRDPIVYVKEPDCNNTVSFYSHNHVPAIIDCENGDLLGIWFTTDDEAGREMTILGSRLRAGNPEWDQPSEFFRVPDRNMTGSSLYRDANGDLIHTNGMEAAGSWQSLAMVTRTIAGIHAGVVQLKNGNFLAFGRGNNILDQAGLDRMPMSVSSDQGKTWNYSSSEFPPIDGGQRLVLRRLKEGPILLISFTNHPYRLKNDQKGMTFTQNGTEFTGYGMFAALSFDEGKTWPVKKLLTDGKSRLLDGGAWTGFFEMNPSHAEPAGYLAATQTPDNVIHLVSSRLHYRFNLKWLTEGTQ